MHVSISLGCDINLSHGETFLLFVLCSKTCKLQLYFSTVPKTSKCVKGLSLAGNKVEKVSMEVCDNLKNSGTVLVSICKFNLRIRGKHTRLLK